LASVAGNATGDIFLYPSSSFGICLVTNLYLMIRMLSFAYLVWVLNSFCKTASIELFVVHAQANDEKMRLEESQRQQRAALQAAGKPWGPCWFEQVCSCLYLRHTLKSIPWLPVAAIKV